MIIEDGKFYFIKDKFFDVFKDYGLMINKENGNKRPCYFCFKDRKDKEIVWFVPISTKYDKYIKIYEKKKVKSGKKPVYNFVFGKVLGKKAVFLIQNIFPTTLKYIEKKYTNSNRDVEVQEVVKKEVITKALRVVDLAKSGIQIPFYNIIEMKKILLEDNINIKYKNIQLTNQFKKANCITHSGKFHVDDIISTIFLSKIKENLILARVPTFESKEVKGKIVFDIGGGEFDHHQKNRNGKRKNGIYYSSIGLLWNKFGKEYLKKIKVKNIDKTFEYMDSELIQYIDATDNMQTEFLKNKISPDFIKLCNPEWNENISEDEAFFHALKLADEFWNIYIKHAIAEVEAMQIIFDRMKNCKESYLIFEKEMPYKKAIKMSNNNGVKYLIFKSRREGYDIRTITDDCKFKNEIVQAKDIETARSITGIKDLLYIDNNSKLCCTKTLESAIKMIKYNEKIEL